LILPREQKLFFPGTDVMNFKKKSPKKIGKNRRKLRS
jgi:hypothetical protein